MKKLLMLLLVLGCIPMSYAQDIVFNCRIENKKKAEIKDVIKREIKHTGNKIIFENYFTESKFENKDLTLSVDSIVPKKKAFENFKRNWYYCTSELGFKYIVIGLESANIHLYQVCSEIEVFEEIFSSLKED